MTAVKNKGLGRGLGAILELENEAFLQDKLPSNRLEEIALTLIDPNPKQPRSSFDEDSLGELADSIEALGIIQPITITPNGQRYTIISGERRWRAAQIAGLKTMPAYVREVGDEEMHQMALVENIQRQDLNAMEIALSLQRLIDECRLTQDSVAARVGKKRSTVANYLRLLSLPPEVQIALKENIISMGHAKAIASADEAMRVKVLKRCIKHGLSVRQTEELVHHLSDAPKTVRQAPEEDYLPESYTRLVERMETLFNSDITIRKGKNGRGEIVIGFATDSDIDSFLDKLNA